MISTFTAFFDANVFFGARLRSLIMELAQTGLFRARWSEDIHREWMSKVEEHTAGRVTVSALEPTRRAMDGLRNLTSGLSCVDINRHRRC